VPESDGPHAPDRSGLVFDLDGTLVDSYEAITDALNEVRAAFGLGALAELAVRRLVGHGLESLLESQVGRTRLDEAVRRFRERYAEVGVARTRALPGVPEGLRTLAAHGYRMAVATNKPARFARPILDALGLACWFDCVVGPDVVGATKPDPALLLHCLRALGVAPRHSRYIGDMVLDVETADRAGVPVLLVRGGSSTDDELRATGRPVCESFDALVARLIADRAAPSPS
jgi:phosphoglycolate phosphatase